MLAYTALHNMNNDVEYHQMVLPLKFQAQALQLLHDGQGHQGMERTIANFIGKSCSKMPLNT